MTSDQPHILMCPPDYYGIEYEINPWMSRGRPSDQPTAKRQWNDLRSVMESVGAHVSTIEPIKGLPDLVFTANAALVFHSTALVAHFRHPQRQGEEPLDAAWFSNHGFEVRRPL